MERMREGGNERWSYLTPEHGRPLYSEYDEIIGKLVHMITHPDDWKF